MKKLNSRLKKVFISLLLVLVCFVGLFGIGLKANAYNLASTGIRVNNSNLTSVVFFNIPYIEDDQVLYTDSNNNTAVLNYRYSTNYNGQKTSFFYFNNNDTRPMQSNMLYCLTFDQTINRIRIYSIDIPLTAPAENNYFDINEFDIVELFSITYATQFTEYIDILSIGFVAKASVSYSHDGYISVINYLLTNDLNQNSLFNYAKREYLYGYNQGHSSGYNTGYNEGQTGANAVSPVWNVLTGIFNSVGAILSIELIPHIPIGLLIFVPLFFIMVMAILSIWRKNW